MSKDVVIAGAIVAACLGLVTVAFVLPKHKKTIDSAPVDTSTTLTTTDSPITPPVPEPPSQTPDNPLAINPNPLPPSQPLPPANFHPPVSFPPTPPVAPPLAPSPLPIEPPPGPTETKVHVVAAHETLGEISMKYYGTSKNWKKIAEANKVDPSDLQPGQKLTIPVIEGSPKVAAKDGGTPAPEAGPGEHVYKVKAGDSYYNIAKRELGNASRWKELEKLNGIPAEELHAGQSIKLPAKEAAPNSPPGALPGAEAPPPVPIGDGRTHVVAKGETLAEISKKYFGTTTKWKEIVKLNPGVDPESLKVGQNLVLPEGASQTPQSLPSAAGGGGASAPGEATTGEYTVQAGDTLESIAVKELGGRKGVKRIIEANPGLDPSKMRLGQKIKIPGKAKPPEQSNPAPAPAPAPASPGFGAPQPGFGAPPSAVPPSFGTPGAGLGPSLPPATGTFGGAPTYPAPPGPAVQPTFGSAPASTPAPPPAFGAPAPAKPAFTQ